MKEPKVHPFYDLPRHAHKVHTIKVDELREHINSLLARPYHTQEQKQAMCLILENVLFSANDYRGFNYVYWLDEGYNQWVQDGKPEDNAKYRGEEYTRIYY